MTLMFTYLLLRWETLGEK